MTPRPARTAWRHARRQGRRRYRLDVIAVGAALAAIAAGFIGERHLEHVDIDPPAASCTRGGPTGPTAVVGRVIDGDTLELIDGRTVRLYCVDTPETQWRQRHTPWCANYDLGKQAAARVEVLVLGQTVTFGRSEDDSSGRDMAAEVYLPDGTELGQWLVGQGLAVNRPDLTDAGRHLPDPAIADACPPGVSGGQKASR